MSKTATARAAAAATRPADEQVTDAQVKTRLHEQLAAEAAVLWATLGATTNRVSSHPIVEFVARVMMYAFGAAAAMIFGGILNMMLVSFGWPLFIAVVVQMMTTFIGCLASWHVSDTVVDWVVAGGPGRILGWVSAKVGSATSAVTRRVLH